MTEAHAADETFVDDRLVCRFCSKKFSRQEHRRRHEQQIHLSSQQSYGCSKCGRAFSRKDAAQRHENGHKIAGAQASSSNQRSSHGDRSSRTKGQSSSVNSYTESIGDYESVTRRASKRVESRQSRKRRLPFRSRASSSDEGTGLANHALVSSNIGGTSSTSRSDVSQWPLTTMANDTSGATTGESKQITITNQLLNLARVHPVSAQQHSDIQHGTGSSDVMHARNDASYISTTGQRTNSSFFAGFPGWQAYNSSAQDAIMFQRPDIDHGSAASALTSTSRHSPESPRDSESEQWLFGAETDQSIEAGLQSLFYSISDTMTPFPESAADRQSEVTTWTRSSSLYSDGAGHRTSLPERRKNEWWDNSQSSALHRTGLEERGEPAWIAVLKTEVSRGVNSHNIHRQVNGMILDEARSKVIPWFRQQGAAARFLRHEDILFDHETMQYLIELYYQNFDSIYPVLHRAFLGLPAWGWALSVVAAAIGARYLRISEMTRFGDVLCEATRVTLCELHTGAFPGELPYILAHALTATALCHSDEPGSVRRGYNYAQSICKACKHFQLFSEDDLLGAPAPGHSLASAWIAWRVRELRRRTGLYIWLLGCALDLTTQSCNDICLEDFALRVPSADNLWNADSSYEWLKRYDARPMHAVDLFTFSTEETTRPLISECADRLCANLRYPKPMNQLAASAMVHLLIRRLRKVKMDMDRLPPTPPVRRLEKGGGGGASVCAPHPPDYARPRDATCDQLDVIHWAALSSSTRARGFEGPIFLHLHLARLVLLTPLEELLSSGVHAGGASHTHGLETLPHFIGRAPSLKHECRQRMRKWAMRDDHKARLAVVHAGAVFWHVRRSSNWSYLEPFAVYLATLTLWAYGMYSQNAESQQQSGLVAPASTSNGPAWPEGDASGRVAEQARLRRRMPRHIQLDRPVDDELVQHFLAHGGGMCLMLESVGSLCTRAGAAQVVREGVELLDASRAVWSAGALYRAALLDRFDDDAADADAAADEDDDGDAVVT